MFVDLFNNSCTLYLGICEFSFSVFYIYFTCKQYVKYNRYMVGTTRFQLLKTFKIIFSYKSNIVGSTMERKCDPDLHDLFMHNNIYIYFNLVPNILFITGKENKAVIC